MSRRSRKWLAAALLTLLLVGGSLYLVGKHAQRPDQMEILNVNGEAVCINEAMVYYKMMQMEFEQIGSSSIWDLEISGLDPQQTAMDRVMESMIRVKVIQSLAGSLKEKEEESIQEKADQLEKVLGRSYMETHGIYRELVEKVMLENYKAYRYEKDAKFLPGSNEEEIENKLQETFAAYDYLDQSIYLQKASIMPMMFYTGQWVEGEWVSYSDAQKVLILEEAQEIRDGLEEKNFTEIARWRSDCWEIEGNPVFSQGAIQNQLMDYGIVYRGQVQTEAADVIFRTKQGEITDVIETKYGYLIVKVLSYPSESPNESMDYEEQLKAARETYKAKIMEELKKQRLEEEWQRLEDESEIQRYDERWESYVRKTTMQ